jgi:predicted nucleic acid-binding protein
MKYIVDTCIINKLIDGLIEPDELPSDGDFVASHIQIDELNRTKDEERRGRLFLVFAKTIDQIVPTESTVIGVSRLDECKISDGVLLETLRNQLDAKNGGKANNSEDALIAEIAVENGYTLLTADYDLSEVAKANGCKTKYWKI